MIPQTRKYFVLTVHHGDEASTCELLQALRSQSLLPERIIVIDHGAAPLSGLFQSPLIQVIRPVENSGYAGGLNVALGFLSSQQDVAGHDIIICMNNDVQLKADSLQKLMEWWREQPVLTLAGIKMGRVNMWSGRAIIDNGINQERIFTSKPYVHGAFFAAPFRVFTKLGGMPDKLFLYWEDVLMSWRAQRKGIQLQAFSDIGASHDDGNETPSSQKLYYLIRNGAFVLESEARGLWWIYWKIYNRLRLLYHWLQGRASIPTRALYDAVRKKLGKSSL